MWNEIPQQRNQPEPPAERTLPWTVRDTWIGVGLLLLVIAIDVVAEIYEQKSYFFQTIGTVAIELSLIIPVILVLGWRRAGWLSLGFRRFTNNAFGLGCSLMLVAYAVAIVNNIILLIFHIQTQGTDLIHTFGTLKSPLGLIVATVLVAPFVEEMFFRGFLFQGFRQRYNWNKAAILSSVIFALFHLQLVSLIPTFAIGYVLSYVYHKSNSIWPGIILHFLVNSFGICVTFAASRLVH